MKVLKTIPFKRGTCTTARYNLLDSGYVEVINSYNEDSSLKSKSGFAQSSKWRSGQIQVKFSDFQPIWGDYRVLETDYDSFVAIYTCVPILAGAYPTEYAWILTRDPLVEGTPEFDAMEAKV